MSPHLRRETSHLKDRLLALAAVVEDAVRLAARAVAERNGRAAADVIRTDADIDRLEVELEEECLKVLALHQPVANDLRLIIAVLRITCDLERIGDLAVNIAGRVFILSGQPVTPIEPEFMAMAVRSQAMVRGAIEALVKADSAAAYRVLVADDEVDSLNRRMSARLEERMKSSPDRLGYFISLLSMTRHLERIADHATNIAEDVIYYLTGEIVRHRSGGSIQAGGVEATPVR